MTATLRYKDRGLVDEVHRMSEEDVELVREATRHAQYRTLLFDAIAGPSGLIATKHAKGNWEAVIVVEIRPDGKLLEGLGHAPRPLHRYCLLIDMAILVEEPPYVAHIKGWIWSVSSKAVYRLYRIGRNPPRPSGFNIDDVLAECVVPRYPHSIHVWDSTRQVCLLLEQHGMGMGMGMGQEEPSTDPEAQLCPSADGVASADDVQLGPHGSRHCPREGCSNYQVSGLDFDAHVLCPLCGYPRLKAVEDRRATCRHPEFRLLVGYREPPPCARVMCLRCEQRFVLPSLAPTDLAGVEWIRGGPDEMRGMTSDQWEIAIAYKKRGRIFYSVGVLVEGED